MLRKLLPQNSIEKELKVEIVTSGIMKNAIELWSLMYSNIPPWKGGDDNVVCLNLPATISEEFARLILTEFNLTVSGSPMADFINEQLEEQFVELTKFVELYCAKGGIVLKPYVMDADENGNPTSIGVDFVQADDFYPCAFNSKGLVTAATFVQSKKIGNYLYTRLEYHELTGRTYTVSNVAYRSEEMHNFTDDDQIYDVKDRFHERVRLGSVDEWASLSETPVVMNGIDRPLFVYIKVPKANNIDTGSPLGVSVISRAVDTIKETDCQYGRILWEYKAFEAGILADESMFQSDRKGRPIIAKGDQRLFRTFDTDGDNNLLEVFAPTIRDQSLFNGLNEQLMIIEQQVGLAYGTLSKAQNIEKTATEIKQSKQRSFHTVNKMQGAWEKGIKQLIEAMRIYALLYEIVPDGNVETTCTWGDGVLEDVEVEYQRRWSMVLAGKLKIEKFFAWYFGCTEEEAKEYIPTQEPYPPEDEE